MSHFGSHKQHGAGVRACRDAATATDACSGFHSSIRVHLRDRDCVSIGCSAHVCGNETACLLDAIQRGATDAEVTQNGECACAEGFDDDGFSVTELAHVELAGGCFAGTVRDAVDGERTHTADAFATVVIESDGLFSARDKVVVDNVEHLEKGTIWANVLCLVGLDAAWGLTVFLAPDFEVKVHL